MTQDGSERSGKGVEAGVPAGEDPSGEIHDGEVVLERILREP